MTKSERFQIIEQCESVVRSYSRSFPAVFARSRGAELFAEDGRRYIDFFAGAGALNYGHNHPALKQVLVDYIKSDGIVHALDMATVAKAELLLDLRRLVLAPRGLDYRVQFPGPTGTNAVEAALKLARKVTGRRMVVCFEGGFHGMTLGALAVTSNRMKRAGAGVPLPYACAVPFDGAGGAESGTGERLDAVLGELAAAGNPAAAVILETVQAEGGVRPASMSWLHRVAEITRHHGALLIVDDVQVGCGRTGPFLSFEPAGIQPDLVVLSKSISGYGLPMSLLLLRPAHDVWQPGEHNGTFRGNNLAFVMASAALRLWVAERLESQVQRRAGELAAFAADLARRAPQVVVGSRGRGMIWGLVCKPGLATAIARAAFRQGLIIETAGEPNDVVKILPPLNIDDACFGEGLALLARAVLAEAGVAEPTQNVA